MCGEKLGNQDSLGRSDQVEKKAKKEDAVSPGGKHRTIIGNMQCTAGVQQGLECRETSLRDSRRIVGHQSLCRPFQGTQQPIYGI